MFAKNTGKKVIGFGGLIILPDETKELPLGYDEKHPTVKFYLSQGFIAKADGIPTETGVDDAGQTDEEKAAQKQAERDNQIKELAKLNLEPLREKAIELGVVIEEADTKAALIDKITAKLQAEQG